MLELRRIRSWDLGPKLASRQPNQSQLVVLATFAKDRLLVGPALSEPMCMATIEVKHLKQRARKSRKRRIIVLYPAASLSNHRTLLFFGAKDNLHPASVSPAIGRTTSPLYVFWRKKHIVPCLKSNPHRVFA